jgi:predicted regulator of Ras-like GTPase activity (Roadblock/LC7/MglB family)
MSMTAILNEAIDRVSGAQIAGVVGEDGLGVELIVASGGGERETIEIELATIAATAAAAVERMGGGELREFILETERATYLASLVARGYYAVLGVGPHSNLGRARFALRRMAARLESEL